MNNSVKEPKSYAAPMASLIVMCTEDVITTSDNFGEWDEQ